MRLLPGLTDPLRPRSVLSRVEEITPHFLDGRGLRGLLLDLDNTLVPYGSRLHRHEVVHWAAELRQGGYALYLLSNATRERARFWTERLGFQGIGLAGKPFPGSYRRALGAVGLAASEVAMVGDQLFTDVLGGNLAGMYTVMVQPISDNALPHTRLTRRVERLILGRFGHDWPAGRQGGRQDKQNQDRQGDFAAPGVTLEQANWRGH